MELKKPENEKQFETLIRRVIRSENVTPVRAIQLTVSQLSEDQIKQDGTQLACGQGCTACCHQMVCVSPAEWEIIEEFLRSQPTDWLDELKKDSLALRQDWLIYMMTGRTNQGQMRVHADWMNRPCVFLSKEGACRIYKVRPTVCRVVTSTRRCEIDEIESEAVRWRYPWEKWGDLMEDESAASGVTPLLYYVWMLLTKI